jgi:hypothetical protein
LLKHRVTDNSPALLKKNITHGFAPSLIIE